jgi:hypothetical protein
MFVVMVLALAAATSLAQQAQPHAHRSRTGEHATEQHHETMPRLRVNDEQMMGQDGDGRRGADA